MWNAVVTTLIQEEDLQEIVTKISSKRAEYDEARTKTAELKASYEKAEQEYKQHKEQINTVAEDADPIKVMLYSNSCQCLVISILENLTILLVEFPNPNMSNL